jgi:hypothetical protein
MTTKWSSREFFQTLHHSLRVYSITAALSQRTGELSDQLEGPRNEIFEAGRGRGGPGGNELIGS